MTTIQIWCLSCRQELLTIEKAAWEKATRADRAKILTEPLSLHQAAGHNVRTYENISG